jgi:hypothetical protein
MVDAPYGVLKGHGFNEIAGQKRISLRPQEIAPCSECPG